MAYRCVQCGFPIKTLYVQYSPGNIRLMKCENCKAVADEYIECEVMVHNPFEKLELYLFKILLIDLILHKPKAYRHLLYNVLNQETVETEGLFWKSTLSFLLLDAYRSLILESSREDWGSSRSFTLLILTCWKMLMDVFFGNLMFFSTFLIMVRIFLRTSLGNPRDKDIVLAISISSYVKVFLIAMMVWEFPSLVIFIIDLFVLSSNIVALKVFTESTMSRCIATCLSAHAVKLFATQVLNFRLLGTWNNDGVQKISS